MSSAASFTSWAPSQRLNQTATNWAIERRDNAPVCPAVALRRLPGYCRFTFAPRARTAAPHKGREQQRAKLMRVLYTLLGGFALFAASLHGQAAKPAAPSPTAVASTPKPSAPIKEIVLTATTANVKESGAPVSIRLFRWSTDEERTALVSAFTAPAGGRPGGAGRPAAPPEAGQGQAQRGQGQGRATQGQAQRQDQDDAAQQDQDEPGQAPQGRAQGAGRGRRRR